MLIMATVQTVWLILAEGGRIRLTGFIVPCAAWDANRVLPAIEILTIRGPWILLTVGVWVLLTGVRIFPGTICYVVPNKFAFGNSAVELDYHPQVRQVVHGG